MIIYGVGDAANDADATFDAFDYSGEECDEMTCPLVHTGALLSPSQLPADFSPLQNTDLNTQNSIPIKIDLRQTQFNG